MTNDAIKLAHLWVELAAVKDKLDNEIVPLCWHLGLEDWELIAALDAASINIERHFEQYTLAAVAAKR